MTPGEMFHVHAIRFRLRKKGVDNYCYSWSRYLRHWQTDLGLFSYEPAVLRGLLLNSASRASAKNGTGTLHAKLDKGFVYANRSYGLSFAAGLMNTTFTSNPLSLSYLETGFESPVSCVYNKNHFNFA
jgi:hypothetical protein